MASSSQIASWLGFFESTKNNPSTEHCLILTRSQYPLSVDDYTNSAAPSKRDVIVYNITRSGTANRVRQLLLGQDCSWHLVKHCPATDTHGLSFGFISPHWISPAVFTATLLLSCIKLDRPTSCCNYMLPAAVESHPCNFYLALSHHRTVDSVTQLLR